MKIELELTDRQAEYLVAAACDFYHKMKISYAHEIFGAYVRSEEVRDAKATWNALEEIVKVAYPET